MGKIKLSVIIPFYNAQRTLEKCLKGLKDQSDPDFEVIFVNNGSTDDSVSLIQPYLSKKYFMVTEDIKGAALARNKGAKVALGNYLVFIDSDCVAKKNWVKNLKKSIKKNKAEAVAGAINGYKPKKIVEKYLSSHSLVLRGKKREFRKFNLISGGFPTANFAIRKELFLKVGGFNESLETGEDYELCSRVYKDGKKILFDPSVKVQHIHRENLLGLLKQSYGFAYGHAPLLKLCFSRFVLIQLPFMNFVNESFPVKIWLNLSSADKKLIFLILLSCINVYFSALIVIYYFYLVHTLNRKNNFLKIKTNIFEKMAMPFLLVLKSAAMTLGSLAGSIRYGVICL